MRRWKTCCSGGSPRKPHDALPFTNAPEVPPHLALRRQAQRDAALPSRGAVLLNGNDSVLLRRKRKRRRRYALAAQSKTRVVHGAPVSDPARASSLRNAGSETGAPPAMMAALTLLAAALVFVVIEMTATWLVARKLRNNGIVDIVWSAGFAPLALLYFFLCSAGQREFDTYPRWIAITTMVVVWGLRLGSHLLVRVCAHHPHEDVRYAKLREEWGAKVDARMFGFFQLQGLLQVLLSLPVMVVRLDENRYADGVGLGLTGLLGVALWATGLLGESLADRQLARFRADPANKGKVCQAGLWNYSRHPNYFFEWLVWVGYAVFALGSPWGWLGLIAPALMLHFLLNVTGIPMTEELSLKSKGDAYRAYQRTTSAFVPWFRRP